MVTVPHNKIFARATLLSVLSKLLFSSCWIRFEVGAFIFMLTTMFRLSVCNIVKVNELWYSVVLSTTLFSNL